MIEQYNRSTVNGVGTTDTTHDAGRVVVFVEWEDTTTDTEDGWMDAPDYKPFLATAFTVGFFVAEDDKTLTLTQSSCFDKNGDGSLDVESEKIDCIITIPKSIIVRRIDSNGTL